MSGYARAGMPVLQVGGFGKESLYDAVACLAWIRQTQGRSAKDVAQVRALEASAKLNELKLKSQAGELVAVEDVIRAGAQYTKAWTAKVRGLARRMIQAGIIDRTQADAVNAIARELLSEISAFRTVEDLERVAVEPEPAEVA